MKFMLKRPSNLFQFELKAMMMMIRAARQVNFAFLLVHLHRKQLNYKSNNFTMQPKDLWASFGPKNRKLLERRKLVR